MIGTSRIQHAPSRLLACLYPEQIFPVSDEVKHLLTKCDSPLKDKLFKTAVVKNPANYGFRKFGCFFFQKHLNLSADIDG